MPETRARGSCLCGSAVYAVDPAGGNFQYCHCSRCRKTGGAAHAANLIVPAGQFNWVEGEQHVCQYEHSNATRYCNAFCSICGSKLPWRSRDGKWMIFTAGTLDDDPGLCPARNIFWGDHAPWLRSPDELPKFDDYPPR